MEFNFIIAILLFNTFYTNPYIDDAHIEEKKNSSNKQIFKDHSDTKNTGQNDMVRIRKTVLIEAKQKIKKKKYTITFKWLKMHGKAKNTKTNLKLFRN